MQVPELLIQSLTDAKGFDKTPFENVHLAEMQITSVRLNPLKGMNPGAFNQLSEPVPWAQQGYYLGSRPSFTFDPLFHAGCYYVQEASSMLLEQAFIQTVELHKPIRVLDLCAAPGGKSTHIQSLLSEDSLLVSNDVIRARANILKENMIKWGSGNVVVTNNDPAHFAQLPGYFDVLVVDAPCSGSGLFRRDPLAAKEWSLNNVQLCHQRQQRILADCWSSLRQNGMLIYATCSYSIEEDEEICKWIMKQFHASPVSLSIDTGWGIVESEGGYRCWPDKVKGEGFFLACFRKNEGELQSHHQVNKRPTMATKADLKLIEEWVRHSNQQFIKHQETVYAWPAKLFADYSILLEKLRLIYSGTICGELMKNKLVPSHGLALSQLLSPELTSAALNLQQAIAYLQRKEIDIVIPETGWKLVTYQQHPIGWMNVLPNRINNYYPKEMRIIKDRE